MEQRIDQLRRFIRKLADMDPTSAMHTIRSWIEGDGGSLSMGSEVSFLSQPSPNPVQHVNDGSLPLKMTDLISHVDVVGFPAFAPGIEKPSPVNRMTYEVGG